MTIADIIQQLFRDFDVAAFRRALDTYFCHNADAALAELNRSDILLRLFVQDYYFSDEHGFYGDAQNTRIEILRILLDFQIDVLSPIPNEYYGCSTLVKLILRPQYRAMLELVLADIIRRAENGCAKSLAVRISDIRNPQQHNKSLISSLPHQVKHHHALLMRFDDQLEILRHRLAENELVESLLARNRLLVAELARKDAALSEAQVKIDALHNSYRTSVLENRRLQNALQQQALQQSQAVEMTSTATKPSGANGSINPSLSAGHSLWAQPPIAPPLAIPSNERLLELLMGEDTTTSSALDYAPHEQHAGCMGHEQGRGYASASSVVTSPTFDLAPGGWSPFKS